MDEQNSIRAAQRGDLDAFNELVLCYQNQVFNLAYRIMGDKDSAADATQEAFLSAFRISALMARGRQYLCSAVASTRQVSLRVGSLGRSAAVFLILLMASRRLNLQWV